MTAIVLLRDHIHFSREVDPARSQGWAANSRFDPMKAKDCAWPRILVLYYSSFGHIETMAHAVAEGVRQAGAEAFVKRVPELVPETVARNSHFKLDQAAPIASVDELSEDDAIILGVPTRFGNMAAQMKNFLDQTGALWFQGKLIGKVGSVFTSTGTQHGGQESTILSTHIVLLHHGMVIVGLPYRSRARWISRNADRNRAAPGIRAGLAGGAESQQAGHRGQTVLRPGARAAAGFPADHGARGRPRGDRQTGQRHLAQRGSCWTPGTWRARRMRWGR